MTLRLLKSTRNSSCRNGLIFRSAFIATIEITCRRSGGKNGIFFQLNTIPVSRLPIRNFSWPGKDGKMVGRICGIIHKLEEKKLGYRRGRFGWFECIDDAKTAQAMLAYLEDWFVREGMPGNYRPARIYGSRPGRAA